MLSLVVPVYKNSPSIAALMEALDRLFDDLGGELELVFVVDGSPDDSYDRLWACLPRQRFRSQLLSLSRNFGAFSAVRAGLAAARGDRLAVMAADLQEPPELIVEFDRLLRSGQVDVVVGQRMSREDGIWTRLSSSAFWALYRRWVQREMPAGGVDIFGCADKVRRELIRLEEINTSLVGLLFWAGFRRAMVPYDRRARTLGESAWTLRKRLQYLSDSLFTFSDLPIRALLIFGMLGLVTSAVYTGIVLFAKLFLSIPVPGYAGTVILVSFFGGLNSLALGILGGYVWRTFENSLRRPSYIVMSTESFDGCAQRT
jgi:glycosyltransferase involved in cell wall biosynthesis